MRFADNKPGFFVVSLAVQSNFLKSNKPIFDPGYSPTSLLIMIGSVLFCSALLVFTLLHIWHYPVLGSLLSFFLIRTILDAKIEKIVVLEDRLVVVTRYVLPFMTRKAVVLLSPVAVS